MKKFLIIIFIFFLTIFHKVIISKIIIINISKWTEREIFVEKININYRNSEIVLEKLEIRGTNQLYYKNIFEADKIKIKYDFRSLFTNLIKIDNLHISNTFFFLEVDDKANSKNTSDGDKDTVKKIIDKNQQPKIYPKKKVDKNFFIIKTSINNSKVFIKALSKSEEIKFTLSDMSFAKVGNAKEAQHFKEVFKFLLVDLLFRIRDLKLRNIIKKTYKL
jgi:hypothetical protein|tara:strand:+ start:529 stop:1185 length:657 start_codon:yes stop_codon:yes gene_type:complete